MESKAWLFKVGHQAYAAVGERELVHVLPYRPQLFEVPHTPAYCRYVTVWQDQILPVMDFGLRIGGSTLELSDTTEIELDWLIAVVAYHPLERSKIGYGALLLKNIPERITVGDDQQCVATEVDARWFGLVSSCFEHALYGRVPILDLAYSFSQ